MEEFIKFCKKFPVKRFDKGELILVQGEVPTCAYVVKRGVVKVYNLTSQGEEKPINFKVSDDLFPIAWAFKKIRYAQYYYEAFSDCELYCLPRQEYLDFLRKSPESAYGVIGYCVDQMVNYEMRVNALEQSKAANKVLNTVHFLCLRFGVEVKKNHVEIRLPLTQQDLANFMGLTRETTGIELKKLQRQGILTYKKQNYVVRTDKLDELLDEDYDQGRISDKITTTINKLKTAVRL